MLKLHTTLVNKFHFEKYAPFMLRTHGCVKKNILRCVRCGHYI